ncbi:MULTISPECIES: cysteine ABC transporter substrate-binding protein [unclassified Paenibacillus]|uniref:cysteine ABC transporter substrate-binding protein n=1 Tax=unclassified Paenibacillus TaxID=185978 RepID=UPI0024069B97|nr:MULTISPECIES: cysteine ABC transporter substrate-binding protein [unclassified Paenibacillus]MDF9844376.1 polar amino acid transport system substrate-binding protein [Paenibacillus sp. PastF-2]MDF9850980.1 polar amino acid transport system substrate-binding protein [Paenibacillus sp. PastM-2]MDF9857551.1 polar amino acid transport system substrate-binding protein [Paenibacillus sp. PastF-1]MDH6482808.1 polar amino acid transport system substrate-binding protein [Paenibacillus sp. PastH-2]MD
MGKGKKLITGIIAASMLLVGLTACGNSDNNDGSNSSSSKFASIEQLKKNGKIRIGVFADKPPFGYVDSEGKNQGFDVYIAKRFAKDLLGDESKAEFVLVDAASRVAYLESNKVDIIMANFTVTDERKEKVDFASPYMKLSFGIVSPDSAPITSIDQLKEKGQKLIVAKGTTAETYFTKEYPDIELLKFDQYTEIFSALKDGRGAAIANDNTELIAWAKSNPGFTVSIPAFGGQDTIAPAVAKGNTELLNWLNTELETLGKEQFIHEAYKATLNEVYGEGYTDELVVEGGKIE